MSSLILCSNCPISSDCIQWTTTTKVGTTGNLITLVICYGFRLSFSPISDQFGFIIKIRSTNARQKIFDCKPVSHEFEWLMTDIFKFFIDCSRQYIGVTSQRLECLDRLNERCFSIWRRAEIIVLICFIILWLFCCLLIKMSISFLSISLKWF